MESLLGFIVLTGPLFLIVLWVPACIALAFWVGKKLKNKSRGLKVISGLAIFLFALLLPITDEIAGRVYFNHLCETEAGAKVYQSIELPAEYWDENGKPEFYVNYSENLGKKYPMIYMRGVASSLFNVDNAGYKFVDKQTDEVLGEVISFRYWGGWLRRNFSLHNSANSCESSEKIINKIFKSEKQG